MEKIHGDLLQLALDGEFDVIVHGCNCFHTMGAGIAKSIVEKFPEALEADKATEYGAKDKLGTISCATIQRGDAQFVIVNAYTQHDWKGRGRKADYEAIRQCFERVAVQFSSARIGYPLIGAGLARGDWSVIEPLIEKALSNNEHKLVLFSG